jgi:hypothetical protein
MIEPSAIAIVTGICVPLLAGLLYLIRAEIRRNTLTTDATHAQTVPNHGTSLRDAVDRIERRIDSVHDDVVYVRGRVDRHIDDHDNGRT